MGLDEYLAKLADLLMSDTVKSQQAAFNLCFDELTEAKEIAGWSNISEYLKIKTGLVFEEKKLWTMYARAKAKSEKQSGRSKPVTIRATLPGRSSREADKNGSEELESNVSDELLKQYIKVCFNNERIALRAIEGGVSIDTIESWKSPNSVRLGNALTNYISKK
ncbi:hypothetical protein FH968_19990 [Buttiauxella sp. B2]|uniref:hypothetical protein n=1 Tax=Buttiauxella sp. B2 TaxID=2587812 RepID=UPI00111FD0C3|nr:hypothetical protein [Buttiauxella sp. B2]TNV16122.1 hypothetical protein FH968_19990 [Buttiauxella sp. B2]